jgi:lsr operon transcriptional repressor
VLYKGAGGVGLLSRVARLYYEHDLTHQEIADLLKLSRVKVTRILAEARQKGIVEIRVKGDTHALTDVEEDLLGAFSLSDAWVVPTFGDNERLVASIAAGGAHALEQLITDGMTIGVNESRAVGLVANTIVPERQIDCQFVPLVGSRGGPGGTHAHESGERLARAFGGNSYNLPAPVLTRSLEAAEAFRSEPSVIGALEMAARADMMVVGIGACDDQMYLVRHGEAVLQEVQSVVANGAVGDVSARFFDSEGNSVPSSFDDRVIGLTFAQHRAIPIRVGLAGDPAKHRAILAAVSSNLVNVLVTDQATAVWLLDQRP